MATVAAGYTWVPFLSFIISVFHFGLSSWLFLYFPKTGKIIAIVTATTMCIWPVLAFIGAVIDIELFGVIVYLMPILFSGIVVYNHIKTFNKVTKITAATRVILSAIPFGLFVTYIYYVSTLIKSGQIKISF
jgi:hypothetical protein